MFFEENIMSEQSECPNIYFWAIFLFSEEFGWHENRSSDDFVVDLFFNSESKIPQFIDAIFSFFFDEDVVGFDVAMHNFFFGNEFQAECELVHDLKSFFFGDGSPFLYDIF